MNLLIVNGYDKNGWSKLAKYKLQPICEFYRDQLKSINPNINYLPCHIREIARLFLNPINT